MHRDRGGNLVPRNDLRDIDRTGQNAAYADIIEPVRDC